MSLVKIPKELRGTGRIEWIFVIIFLSVLIIHLFNFPLKEFLNGNAKGEFKGGWPMNFFILDFENLGENPLLIWPLLINLTVYLLMAYMIDVLLNYIKKTIPQIIKESEEEIKVQN